MIKSIFLGGIALAALAAAPASAQTTALRVNQIADVQGVKTACGGASLDDQQSMGAENYPVTLKLVGGYGQWLGEENLTVTGNGQSISFACEGPWVSMQLTPGRYKATADVQGASPKTVSFTVGQGSREVMIRFPELKSGRGQNYQKLQQQQPATPSSSM
jgi:hypothetical protein